MSRILVSGSLAYDRIMDFPGLFSEYVMPERLNTINLSFQVDKLSVEFGGTAGNIAYNLALFSEQADIIATVGQDFGAYRSHMLLSGVDPARIHILEGQMTSSAYVFTDRADNQIAAFHAGAGASTYDTPVTTQGKELAIISPGCVPDMVALAAHYRRNNLRYFFDPGQQIPVLTADQLRESINGAEMLIASDYEFELIKRKIDWTELEFLRHVSAFVVTLGAEGSRILMPEREAHIPAVAVKNVVDPTGAGDAFRAGFIKGYLARLPLDTAAKIGSAAASFVVETYGTQNHRFSMEELKERYQGTYGEPLPL